MTEWLNSRAVRLTAWAIVALLSGAAAGFAAFLLVPAVTHRTGSAAPDRGRNSAASATAARVTVTPVPAIVGTVDQVQGRVLVVREANGGVTRVLLSDDTRIGQIAVAADLSAIPNGGSVILGPRMSRPDGTISTNFVFLGTVVQFIAAFGVDPRETDAQLEFCRTGTVTVLAAGRLHVSSPCGEQTVELVPGAQVVRIAPRAAPDLRAGVHVTVVGDRLVDGSIAGRYISLIEAR